MDTHTHEQDERSESGSDGFRQARAQYDSIAEMITDLELSENGGDEDAREQCLETIREDPLSVQVRSDWYSPGAPKGVQPAEYEILLCTGGPAVRIVGTLSKHNKPESARIEHQDWFTPWKEYRALDLPGDYEETLLAYAHNFYFAA